MHACNVNNRGAARGRAAKSCGMVKKVLVVHNSCNLTSALPISSVRSGSGIMKPSVAVTDHKHRLVHLPDQPD